VKKRRKGARGLGDNAVMNGRDGAIWHVRYGGKERRGNKKKQRKGQIKRWGRCCPYKGRERHKEETHADCVETRDATGSRRLAKWGRTRRRTGNDKNGRGREGEKKNGTTVPRLKALGEGDRSGTGRAPTNRKRGELRGVSFLSWTKGEK